MTSNSNIKDLLFTIILPAYNVEEYITKCIDSIKMQEYINWETIIVNDGSSDRTLEICKENTKNDERFIVIDKHNCGVSEARNTGMSYAKGDYIVFCDSDDYLHPMLLSCLNQKIKSTPDIDICIYGYTIVQQDIFKKEKLPLNYYGDKSGSILYMLFKNNLFGLVWNKAIRRSILDENHIIFDPHIKIFEDQEFMYHVWNKSRKIMCIAQTYYFYVQRLDSALGFFNDKISRDVVLLLNIYEKNIAKITKFLKNNNVDSRDLNQYVYMYTKVVLTDILKALLNTSSYKIDKDIDRIFQSFITYEFLKLYETRQNIELKEKLLKLLFDVDKKYRLKLFWHLGRIIKHI